MANCINSEANKRPAYIYIYIQDDQKVSVQLMILASLLAQSDRLAAGPLGPGGYWTHTIAICYSQF
jgi:hypothetical protein